MKIEKRCLECGKLFSVHPYREKTAKFCSFECKGRWQMKLKNPAKDNEIQKKISKGKTKYTLSEKRIICEVCGKVFYDYPSKKRRFCSNECRGKWLEKHPVNYWLGKKRPEVKEFFTTKGKHHTKEWKEQRSKALRGRAISEKQKRDISQTLMGHPANTGSGRGKSGFREDIGIYVRSRWEANVVRVFLFEEMDYLYEPQKFFFEDCSYTPDFYLPELDWWVEVKGYMSEEAKQKIERFKELGFNLLVVDKSIYKQLEERYEGAIEKWEK